MCDDAFRACRAIVYSPETGLRSFGELPGGSNEATLVSGGSRDGSTLIGHLRSGSGQLAFRYREATGVQILPSRGEFTEDSDWAHEYATGSERIIGTSQALAAIWDDQLELTTLGSLNGAYPASYGYAMSADGSRVVGKSWNGQFKFQAFLWADGVGMIGLGSSDAHYGEAVAISDAGTTIFGMATQPGGNAPFIWRESIGFEPLAPPAGYWWNMGVESHFAMEATADGTILVGSGLAPFLGDPVAFIYTSDVDVRPLADYLGSIGLDLGGWTLTYASGISKNGRFIVGSGIDPTGRSSAWLVDLPEPSTSMPLLFGFVWLGFLRRCARPDRCRA